VRAVAVRIEASPFLAEQTRIIAYRFRRSSILAFPKRSLYGPHSECHLQDLNSSYSKEGKIEALSLADGTGAPHVGYRWIRRGSSENWLLGREVHCKFITTGNAW